MSAWFYGDDFGGTAVDHIAKVRIEGTITEDEELIKRLENIRQSSKVKGVILSIDSPGGTTAGGEAIFEEVRKLAAEKPVVAQVGTLAASAGYMIASATDHIVARKSSIVGSIGVLVQYPDVTGLMDKVGIKLEEVKSSPLKAEPSPFNPTTDDERAMVRKLILDSYDWFVGIVDERRPLTREQALALADGSIFTGRQALANKLIDAARRRDARRSTGWRPRASTPSSRWSSGRTPNGAAASCSPKAMARSDRQRARPAGLTAATSFKKLGADRLFLDGLVSVWHP